MLISTRNSCYSWSNYEYVEEITGSICFSRVRAFNCCDGCFRPFGVDYCSNSVRLERPRKCLARHRCDTKLIYFYKQCIVSFMWLSTTGINGPMRCFFRINHQFETGTGASII